MIDYELFRNDVSFPNIQVREDFFVDGGTVRLNLNGTNNTGDIFYRNSSGELQQLPISSNGKILGIVGNLPAWVDDQAGGSDYTLPVSTSSILGGVKIGANINVTGDGTISITFPTYATVASTGSYDDLINKPTIPPPYTLPVATTTVLGGVKGGSNVAIAADGTLSVTHPTYATVASTGNYNDLNNRPTIPSQYTDAMARLAISLTTIGSGAATYNDTTGVLNVPTPTPYSLPIASASVLGGIKVGANLSIDVNGVLSASGGGTSLTINNNADNRILTANGGTTSIEAESGLTWNGNSLIATSGSQSANIFEAYALNSSNASIQRTVLYNSGTQEWKLNSVNTERGSIVYGTPGDVPGILFYNYNGGTPNRRSQIRLAIGGSGLGFGASATASSPGDQMTLATTGNLGIGLAAPDARLHTQVQSDTTGELLRLTSLNVAGTLSSMLKFTASATGGNITIDATGTSARDLIFQRGGTESMRILGTNGNVGIGTADPQAKFVVAGNTNTSMEFGASTAANITGSYIEVVDRSGQSTSQDLNLFVSAATSKIKFHTASIERMRIDQNGNVGIAGISDSTAKLLVTGDIALTGSTLHRVSGVNVLNIGSDSYMYGGAANSDGGVFVYGNNKLHLSTNSTRRLTIDGAGNTSITALGGHTGTQYATVNANGTLGKSLNLTTYQNGLNFDTGAAELGGTLYKNTTISSNAGYYLNFSTSNTVGNYPVIGISGRSFLTGGAFTHTVQHAYTGLYGSLDFNTTGAQSLLNNVGVYTGIYGQIAAIGSGDATVGVISAITAASVAASSNNVHHLAGLQVIAPRQLAGQSAFTGTISNYYGLLIQNSYDSDLATARITNRYGIFQEGIDDINVFEGVVKTNKDFEVNTIGNGVIIKSPNGSRWRITVNNSGQLTTTAI